MRIGRLPFALLALAGLASAQTAQVFTTTLPWVDGNTIVVSQSLDALGETVAVQTLSTIALTGTATTRTGLTTATTTALTQTTLPTTTSTTVPLINTRTTTSRTTTAATTTAYQGPVAQTTLCTAATCATSTSYYWFTSDGVVYSTYFSPTFNTATDVIPVSSGTVLEYSSYASSNGAAIQSAAASQQAVQGNSGAGLTASMWGWTAVLGGIVAGGALLA